MLLYFPHFQIANILFSLAQRPTVPRWNTMKRARTHSYTHSHTHTHTPHTHTHTTQHHRHTSHTHTHHTQTTHTTHTHTHTQTRGGNHLNEWWAIRRSCYLHNERQIQETGIDGFGGIRIGDHSNQAASYLRLGTHGCRYRQITLRTHCNKTYGWRRCVKYVRNYWTASGGGKTGLHLMENEINEGLVTLHAM